MGNKNRFRVVQGGGHKVPPGGKFTPSLPWRWFMAPKIMVNDWFFTIGFMWRPSSRGFIFQCGPFQLFIGKAAIRV